MNLICTRGKYYTSLSRHVSRVQDHTGLQMGLCFTVFLVSHGEEDLCRCVCMGVCVCVCVRAAITEYLILNLNHVCVFFVCCFFKDILAKMHISEQAKVKAASCWMCVCVCVWAYLLS